MFEKLLDELKLRNKLKKINKKKYNIFVCYHKPFEIFENEVLTPIHAGRSVALAKTLEGSISQEDFSWMKSKMIGDDTDEEISDKNRYYNECTVSYWFWKNIKSPYLGLFHYRRIFDLSVAGDNKQDNIYEKYGITQKNIDSLMSEYDVILPQRMGFDNSIYDVYARYFIKDDIDFAFEFINKNYPEIFPYAEKLKTTNSAYLFNMFITKKEIYNNYAKFLFDVLNALENHITDRETRDLYQQRAEGFLAERLTSIYFDYIIEKQNLKVLDAPVVRLDRENIPKTTKQKNFALKNDKKKGLSLMLKIKF